MTENWFRCGDARQAAAGYYKALRQVLRLRPDLRCGTVRCAHCGILVLSHPCNRGRRDIRCPFGCRQHHARKESNRRSAAYDHSDEGRGKKKALNARRTGTGPTRPTPPPHPDFCRAIVEYLRQIVGRIERRRVERREIAELLARVMRQRSLDFQAKPDSPGPVPRAASP